MAISLINIKDFSNTGNGNPMNDALQRINNNFAELSQNDDNFTKSIDLNKILTRPSYPVAMFGDSITSQNHTAADGNTKNVNGHINQLAYMLRGLMPSRRENDLGIDGNTTTQMAARLADVTARAQAGIKYCHFMGGTNDITTLATLSNITTNIVTILNHITANQVRNTANQSEQGMICFVYPVLPRSGWGALVSNGNGDVIGSGSEIALAKQKVLDINAYVKNYCLSNSRCVWLGDAIYPLFDPAFNGSVTPLLLRDGTHLSALGATTIARAVYPFAIKALNENIPVSNNIALNPKLTLLSGGNITGGLTSGITVTGLSPLNWSIAGSAFGNAANHSLSIERDPVDGKLILDYQGVLGAKGKLSQ